MSLLSYIIIDNEKECDIVCSQLLNEKYISVDTEFFLKDKKFELSVIQIGTATNNYLIDFIALNFNMPRNLKLLFENNQIIKIFHNHIQDLDILNVHYEIMLSNIFDTQIAMMFITNSEIYSYKNLVKQFLKVELDKSHKLDNWEVRPLTQAQIEYAISDVFYLYKIYPLIVEKLFEKNRIDWVIDYMSNLTSTSKLIESRIQRIIKDSNSKLTDKVITKIDKIREINNLESDNLNNGIYLQNKKNTLNYDEVHIFELLKYFLRYISIDNSIASRVICDKTELIALIKKQKSSLDFGWRYEIFGKSAIELVNGNLKIVINNLKLVMVA